jgi:hypothetical protein
MNNTELISKPLLVEPGVKYFLKETLKHCHDFKMKYYNILMNIGLGILFLLILFGVLVYKYKGKMTPHEKEMKNQEKQQYILSKIKNYQDAKLRSQQQLITNLPQWNNEIDYLHQL